MRMWKWMWKYVEMSEDEELGCGNGCGNTWK